MKKKVLKFQEDVGYEFAVRESEELLTLKESAGDTLPEKLVVEIEAIHNGITLNHVLYSSEELNASTETWTTPFQKPVIKNHDMHSEPLGRIISARYGASKRALGKETVILTAEITDPDAIKKIRDGRYQTVSVGGTAESAICSVCNKDIINEGYCGHSRGKTYKTKEGDMQRAYYAVQKLKFDEVSFVNAPADIHAGITNKDLSAVKAQEEGEVGESQERGKVAVTVNESKQGEEGVNPLDTIDNIIGVSESTNSNTEKVVENNEEEVEKVTLEEMATGGEQNELSLEEQFSHASSRITELESELTTLKEAKTQLSETVNQLNQTIETQESQNAALKSANLQMATYIRGHLIEQVVELRMSLGLEESRETCVEDYASVPTRMIEKQIKEYKQQLQEKGEKKAVRESVIGAVANPTLAVKDKTQDVSASTEDDETLTESSTKPKEDNFSVDEAIDSIVGFFSQRKNY